jgi:hypothetical protein
MPIRWESRVGQLEFWDIQPDSEESSRGRIQKRPLLGNQYIPFQQQQQQQQQQQVVTNEKRKESAFNDGMISFILV